MITDDAYHINKEKINKELDDYYLGNLIINARAQANNIEILCNIEGSSNSKEISMEISHLKENSNIEDSKKDDQDYNTEDYDNDCLNLEKDEDLLDISPIKEHKVE